MISPPERVQLSRKKGWRMPPNTVKVCRPGEFGNHWHVGIAPKIPRNWKEVFTVATASEAVANYRAFLESHPAFLAHAREKLCGKNLACWCPIGSPCHGDVLLEIANAP